VVFLILLVVLMIGSLVGLVPFFLPIVGWLVWRPYDRTADLEKRLVAVEKFTGEEKPSNP